MSGAGYLPIADYAAIGNLRTVALVGRDGSVDWCCFPHMDSPSVFGAILDTRRGGLFRVSPRAGARGGQAYEEGTNVLHTTFETAAGRLVVTDFLPLQGSIHGRGGSVAPPELHRVLRCEGGPVEVEVEWSPRLDYGRAATRVERTEGGWAAHAGDAVLALAGMDEGEVHGAEGHVAARLTLLPGEPRALVCRWGDASGRSSRDASMARLEETIAAWRRWDCGMELSWAGAHRARVRRSALALKLLTHADTGAIAAAPTTSLPEEIGGERNWDYRFTWVRDAALTAQALTAVGHNTEAGEFLRWIEHAAQSHGEHEWGIQIMYGLHGEAQLPESLLSHLEGYRGSAPVRVGNAAHRQLQLDIYGELLDSAWEAERRGVRLEPAVWSFLERVADLASRSWARRDNGIWEVRGDPAHHVHSQVMLWVALDRALRLRGRMGSPAARRRWKGVARKLRARILERGTDPRTGAFVQTFGGSAPDAANLRIPIEGFLPASDARVQATIDATLAHLTEGGLVYRYRTGDGLPGEEGAFVLCTCWLVDALCLSGRVDEACELFENVAGRANHVGLLAEQIDPAGGELLGNFPQAFSHIGLINSALYLARAAGSTAPADMPPEGSPQRAAGRRR